MHSHRRFRQVKHRRDLLGGELLAALEEHGRPLLRGELLDRLPDLAHVSLRPHGLDGIDERRRLPLDGIALTLLGTAAPAEEPPPSPPSALMIQTAVDEDAVEPGRELRLPREGPRRLVQADERFLGAILGVFPVAHDGPGDAIRPLLVALHEVVEGSPVPVRDSLAERFIGRRESLHWRRSSHMVVGEPKPWPELASASPADRLRSGSRGLDDTALPSAYRVRRRETRARGPRRPRARPTPRAGRGRPGAAPADRGEDPARRRAPHAGPGEGPGHRAGARRRRVASPAGPAEARGGRSGWPGDRPT